MWSACGLQVTLKKPAVKLMTRKNDIRPFEDATSIEFLTERNDCGAFALVSHNKKRPHNLVMVSPSSLLTE